MQHDKKIFIKKKNLSVVMNMKEEGGLNMSY